MNHFRICTPKNILLLGEHIPITNKEKFGQPNPEGKINAFHYRGTTLLILAMCLLVTCTEWISGTDAKIDCLHNGPIPPNVINNYCYIMGTFTLPRKYFHGEVSQNLKIISSAENAKHVWFCDLISDQAPHCDQIQKSVQF